MPVGIIPALAGNTSRGSGICAGRPDHPRSRGEYGWQVVGRVLTAGSSPLSRGIRDADGDHSLHPRIIPALAGNTRHRRGMSTTNSDHPRSRGEYAPRGLVRNSVGGSSPLSRGILPRSQPSRVAAGIIPALAGNTSARAAARPPTPDHPRSRGEYGTGDYAGDSHSGSSPLSRGIRDRLASCYFLPRIIPALAGNTRLRRRRFPGWWDHPRSRGEYVWGLVQLGIQFGSSPLSRGIPGAQVRG